MNDVARGIICGACLVGLAVADAGGLLYVPVVVLLFGFMIEREIR